MKAQTEQRAEYRVTPLHKPENEDAIIAQAVEILRKRIFAYIDNDVLDSPGLVRQYLTLKYAQMEHEEFGVIWLDTHSRVLAMEPLFRGTVAQTSVYPREVVKAGLACNAAAAVLFHNHPSMTSDPSTPDKLLTDRLRKAFELVDIRLLDHFIIAGLVITSFAEQGLL